MKGSNQLEIHCSKAELRVEFDVAFESVHRILVEHFAVRAFEHVLFKPAPPAVCQIKPVQVLDDYYLVQRHRTAVSATYSTDSSDEKARP